MWQQPQGHAGQTMGCQDEGEKPTNAKSLLICWLVVSGHSSSIFYAWALWFLLSAALADLCLRSQATVTDF